MLGALTNKMAVHGYSAVLILLALITTTLPRCLHFVVLLPANTSYPFSLRLMEPVFLVATEVLQQSPNWNKNCTIDVTYLDSGPDRVQAPHAAYTEHTRLQRSGEVMFAFIGPICDEALISVARQANIWGVPVLTAGGTGHVFDDRRQFSTLVRFGLVTVGDIVYMLQDLMYKYSWRRAKLLCTRDSGVHGMYSVCAELGRFLMVQHGDEDMEDIYGGEYAFDDHYRNEDVDIVVASIRDDYEEMLLDEVGGEYAVVILCAPHDISRSIMITAHRLKFTNGNYVFIVLDLFRLHTPHPWHMEGDSDERDAQAKQAYDFVLNIIIDRQFRETFQNISLQVHQKALQLKYDISHPKHVNYILAELYDAFVISATEVNDAHYGLGAVEHILNNTYQGLSGDIRFHPSGRRYSEYTICQVHRTGRESTGNFERLYIYKTSTTIFDELREADWRGFYSGLPGDKPTCPYNENCNRKYTEYVGVLIALVVIIVCAGILAMVLYRRYRRGFQLANLEWRVRWGEVRFESKEKHELAFRRNSSESSVCGTFTDVGFVRGKRVSIKFLSRETFTIDMNALGEFKRLLENTHEHICKFVGACLDLGYQSILTEYYTRGSLKDVLENVYMHLEWAFRFSFVQDVAKGMAFLHSSEFQSHGNLTSSNCLVDDRFVIKLTDFGLHFLRDDIHAVYSDDNIYEKFQKMLSVAPELLRLHERPPKGTQKGDVYSFAIICQEIVYRSGSFYIDAEPYVSPNDKYDQVIRGVEPHFRPTLRNDDCYNHDLYSLIIQSWSEETHERPTFPVILETLVKVSQGTHTGSILDNLVQRMETYASDLEGQVEARTAALIKEKQRADEILHLMLPRTVAKQLIKGETVPPEWYDSVTIFFSDIVGFTALSASCTPMDIVGMLNDLYTAFDSLSDDHDVYKVETIGDAYMVVSGLPVRNGIQHAAEIAWMALSILSVVRRFRIKFRPDKKLQLRIGLHTGPVCTGVVGHKMPRYCLFGNTVTTAASYESSGLPLKIHISEETKELLDQIGSFDIAPRGIIEMKTRGKVHTYWVMGSSSSRAMSRAPSVKGSENSSFLALTSNASSQVRSVPLSRRTSINWSSSISKKSQERAIMDARRISGISTPGTPLPRSHRGSIRLRVPSATSTPGTPRSQRDSILRLRVPSATPHKISPELSRRSVSLSDRLHLDVQSIRHRLATSRDDLEEHSESPGAQYEEKDIIPIKRGKKPTKGLTSTSPKATSAYLKQRTLSKKSKVPQLNKIQEGKGKQRRPSVPISLKTRKNKVVPLKQIKELVHVESRPSLSFKKLGHSSDAESASEYVHKGAHKHAHKAPQDLSQRPKWH